VTWTNFLPKFSPSLKVLVKGRAQRGLWDSTDDSIHLLSALENHARRDAANTVGGRNAWTLVCVQLDRFDFAVVLSCKFVDDRSDHAARPTPGSPEINQHWNGTVDNLLFEGAVVDVDG